MHPNCQLMFEKHARSWFKPNMRVLEIGPDAFPSSFNRCVNDSSITWDTIDIYSSPKLAFKATTEYSFPIPDNAYDIVFSAQVIEHVRKVSVWIKEVARVCKPGGLVITINPVSWSFHQAPIDCWRMYPDGMKALYDEANLDVILSTFESLEKEHPGRRYIPGKSSLFQNFIGRIVFPVLNKIGLPDERSFDTLTIGRKK